MFIRRQNGFFLKEKVCSFRDPFSLDYVPVQSQNVVINKTDHCLMFEYLSGVALERVIYNDVHLIYQIILCEKKLFKNKTNEIKPRKLPSFVKVNVSNNNLISSSDIINLFLRNDSTHTDKVIIKSYPFITELIYNL